MAKLPRKIYVSYGYEGNVIVRAKLPQLLWQFGETPACPVTEITEIPHKNDKNTKNDNFAE